MTTGKLDLSVVLLCYRSEDALPSYVKELEACLTKLNIDWEIILVGNYISGSNDQTPDIAREIASQDSRIKVLAKEKEGMMGWDMKSGFESASGKAIAVTDGDGQFPLDDVGRVYQELITGNLDLVKTYRIKRGDGWYRKILSSVYNFILIIFFPGLSCRDVNSKPKIFRADVLHKMDLISEDWFIDAEIMIKARRLNLKFAEISTEFTKLDSRGSFVNPSAIIEFIVNIILFRLREFRFLFRK